MLIPNPKGNYSFLPAIEAFSAGAVAMKGFEVMHVTFAVPPPYREGFEIVDRFLSDRQRPPQALCGVELRSPRPMPLAIQNGCPPERTLGYDVPCRMVAKRLIEEGIACAFNELAKGLM